MKTSTVSIIALLMMSFPLFSCQMEKDTIKWPSGDEFKAEVRNQNPDRPAEIPSPDAWINRALLLETISWREIDHWYRNELPLLKDQPDYYNQKSIAISGMVISKDFLEEADYDELVFYAKEVIEDDNMLGNVKVVADILEKAAFNNPQKEKDLAQLAKMAESKYKDHYRARSIQEKEEYVEKYTKSFLTLTGLQYDQWGTPKY